MPESDPAIIGMYACGCVTYVNSLPDELDEFDEKAMAHIVAAGGQVLRTTVGEAKALPHFLPARCPHDPPGWHRTPSTV